MQVELSVSIELFLKSIVFVWTIAFWSVSVVEATVSVLKCRVVVHLVLAVTWSHHCQNFGESLPVLNTIIK